MRRFRTIGMLFLTLVLLYSLIESILSLTGRVGTFNAIRRMAADAPTIELYGQTLAYTGTENLPKGNLIHVRSTKDHSKAELYQLASAPDNSPYVFVLKSGETYFKYRIPRAAWSM